VCSVKSSIWYCGDCEQHFCKECTVFHNKFKALQTHQVHNVNTKEYEEVLQIVKYKICSAHNQNIDIYCTTCKQYICMKCAIIDHDRHNFLETQKIVDEKKKKLEKFLSELKTSLNVFTEQLNNLNCNNYKGEKNLITFQIQQRGNILKKEIDTCVNSLIDEVNMYDDLFRKKYNIYLESAKKENDVIKTKIKRVETQLKNLNVQTIRHLKDDDYFFPQWKQMEEYDINFVSDIFMPDFMEYIGQINYKNNFELKQIPSSQWSDEVGGYVNGFLHSAHVVKSKAKI